MMSCIGAWPNGFFPLMHPPSLTIETFRGGGRGEKGIRRQKVTDWYAKPIYMAFSLLKECHWMQKTSHTLTHAQNRWTLLNTKLAQTKRKKNKSNKNLPPQGLTSLGGGRHWMGAWSTGVIHHRTQPPCHGIIIDSEHTTFLTTMRLTGPIPRPLPPAPMLYGASRMVYVQLERLVFAYAHKRYQIVPRASAILWAQTVSIISLLFRVFFLLVEMVWIKSI